MEYFDTIQSHTLMQICPICFSLAGCDGLDSDGDGQVDYCEDQYPPKLAVRNVEAFRCDYHNADESRFCYTAEVFKDEKQVELLLRDNFIVIDDCPSTRLDMEVKKIGGTCKSTRYSVKPIQDTGCAPGSRGELNTTQLNPLDATVEEETVGSRGGRNITHLNPLDGTAEEVTVYLDELPPSVSCGFNQAPHVMRNNSVSANGKTLYHRLGDIVGSRLKLNNAEFFYTFNVSTVKQDFCNV
jgi:hypothetical protein